MALSGMGAIERQMPAQEQSGALDRAVVWIWTKQRQFHRRLTSELGGINGQQGSALLLVLISFLYGIFHAAGPGHGKVILTTYLLSYGSELRRSVIMASATAMMQGLTAVVIVYGLIFAAGWLPRETTSAVDWAERFSFLLVSAVGLFLLSRGVISTWKSLKKPHAKQHVVCCAEPLDKTAPNQVEQLTNWRAFLGVVFAVGLRPCSGAVLILIFAHVMKIHWAGIAAVGAMSLGTAITVSSLALIAVNARQWAHSVTNHRSSRWWSTAGGLAVTLGGIVITTIGVSLLVYSYGSQHPLGL
jgi:ABC-type nickel/cobalt efflux system permease component RcnA